MQGNVGKVGSPRVAQDKFSFYKRGVSLITTLLNRIIFLDFCYILGTTIYSCQRKHSYFLGKGKCPLLIQINIPVNLFHFVETKGLLSTYLLIVVEDEKERVPSYWDNRTIAALLACQQIRLS